MKKIVLIIVSLVLYNSFAQNIISNKNDVVKIDNIPFFNNNSFILEYFLINNERIDLDVTNPLIPQLIFNLNEETNLLDANINGYCNGTSATYEVNENYLIVISRGGTTLIDCGSDEETDFFEPITGNIYEQQPPEKVHYEITEDNLGVWLWMVGSHKLFFTKATLGVENINLEKLVKIFPNPTSNYLNIESPTMAITKISIFDPQGKKILIKTNNLDNINVSNLNRGIYFLKLETNQSTFTKKIILH